MSIAVELHYNFSFQLCSRSLLASWNLHWFCMQCCPVCFIVQARPLLKQEWLWCVFWLPWWIIKTVALCVASLDLQIAWRDYRLAAKIGNGKKKSNLCLLPTLSLFIPQKSDLVTGLSFKRETEKQILAFEGRRGKVHPLQI